MNKGARKLFAHRHARCMPLHHAAEELNISVQALYDIECGRKHPSPGLRTVIADWTQFEVSPSDWDQAEAMAHGH